MNAKISEIELKNNSLKAEIINNKSVHKQKIVEYENTVKYNRDKLATFTEENKFLKAEYEKLKTAQSDKIRKFENKSKMYLGILKH